MKRTFADRLNGERERNGSLNIREARCEEAEVLTNIAIASESYWDFDSAYMNNFKVIYKITEKFIQSNPTYVIEIDQCICGFYSILTREDKTSLEYLYIDPPYIGQGYGRELWVHMVDTCKKLSISSFEIVTSPEVRDFYLKMGALQIGEVESLVKKGRRIPKFIFYV